jgi:hypothetical protein
VLNIFLAFFLSLTLTIVGAVLYVFYPVVSAYKSALFNSRDHVGGVGGIVVGGASESLLVVFLLFEPILFLLIFALLQRRRSAAVPVKSQTV